MTVATRVGVMGGTFDPFHCGHLELGRAAVAALSLTRLLVLPTNVPPHRAQPTASSHHRFAMAAMAVAGHICWEVSDLELQSPGFSYTTETLARLHAAGYAPSALFFVVGADAFAEVETWKNYPAFLEQANFAVVSRPGCRVDTLPARLPALASRMGPARVTSNHSTSIFLIDAMTADVSSTAIREQCRAGQSIDDLVDARVAQHIRQHRLYAPEFPHRREDT